MEINAEEGTDIPVEHAEVSVVAALLSAFCVERHFARLLFEALRLS